ncbi:MAG TPA: UbiA family prenyltransferase [Chitinivibrionales bacterium]|nr:UbiA family prenyltransferase [Chitinivibrionales bacterium]
MTVSRLSFNSVAALVRPLLSLAVACSAVAGYVLFSRRTEWRALAAFAGVFLLACAASAVNQVQESAYDVRMGRTKSRPLPMRKITSAAALRVAFSCGLAGAGLLFCTTALAGLLGLATLAWYNGVYTPLKPKTRFAVLLGALVGALPPVIGYTAAGGAIVTECTLISLFMFSWQVAHFQLLMVKYGKEYEAAGFVPLIRSEKDRLTRISVLVWVAAASACALAFPLFNGETAMIWWVYCTCAAGGAYFLSAAILPQVNFRAASFSMYLFQASILGTVIVGSLASYG